MVTFVLLSLALLCPLRTCNPLFTKPSLITYIYRLIKKKKQGEGGIHPPTSTPPLRSFFFTLVFISYTVYIGCMYICTHFIDRQIWKRRKWKALNLILWHYRAACVSVLKGEMEEEKEKNRDPLFLIFLSWLIGYGGLPSIRWQTGERLR